MSRTVQQIINTLIADVPGAPFAETVDVLKIGSPDQTVTGIVVTFLATYDVIDQAIHQGANFIIAHEPLFYNHLDAVDWLAGNSVYAAKRKLLQDNGVAVWRFHDYLHSLKPDPTWTGILRALDWNDYTIADKPFICQLPPRSLRDVADELKAKLNLNSVRVVGDLDMQCANIGIMVGAPGGKWQIPFFDQAKLDVLLCGEIAEWETNIYVRDAIGSGQSKALIVFGHEPGEAPGMREVIPWLQARLPEETITYIPSGHAFASV